MFGRKIVKRCARGHVMELAWRRCPRCTGRAAKAQSGRDITDQTMIAAPAASGGDETRIFTPSVSRAPAQSAPVAPPPPPPPPPPGKLEVIGGPLAGQSFVLTPGVYRLGKNPPAGPDATHVTLTGDRYVSKVHAVLTMGVAQLVLSDPGSTNGTFVNGERVSRTVLKNGDEVRMGESLFRIVLNH